MDGPNGYYLEPFLIKRIIIDETKIGMSFVELKKFIEEFNIQYDEEIFSIILVLDDECKYVIS